MRDREVSRLYRRGKVRRWKAGRERTLTLERIYKCTFWDDLEASEDAEW